MQAFIDSFVNQKRNKQTTEQIYEFPAKHNKCIENTLVNPSIAKNDWACWHTRHTLFSGAHSRSSHRVMEKLLLGVHRTCTSSFFPSGVHYSRVSRFFPTRCTARMCKPSIIAHLIIIWSVPFFFFSSFFGGGRRAK